MKTSSLILFPSTLGLVTGSMNSAYVHRHKEKHSCAQGHVALTLGHTNTELHSYHPNPDWADLLQTTTRKIKQTTCQKPQGKDNIETEL